MYICINFVRQYRAIWFRFIFCFKRQRKNCCSNEELFYSKLSIRNASPTIVIIRRSKSFFNLYFEFQAGYIQEIFSNGWFCDTRDPIYRAAFLKFCFKKIFEIYFFQTKNAKILFCPISFKFSNCRHATSMPQKLCNCHKMLISWSLRPKEDSKILNTHTLSFKWP